MVVVCGPRIDPTTIDAPPGVDVRGYVPRLYEHFAACDVAVVHGGGTSTLELTALRRPFVYFPLEGHAEQTLVVAKRLAREGAGRAANLSTGCCRPAKPSTTAGGSSPESPAQSRELRGCKPDPELAGEDPVESTPGAMTMTTAGLRRPDRADDPRAHVEQLARSAVQGPDRRAIREAVRTSG